MTLETPPRRTWLWAVTALSLAIFCTGLGLRVFARTAPGGAATAAPLARPAETPAPPVAPAAADAGDSQTTAPAEPAAPEGMLLVRDAAGKPAFFVARAPVTHREYAELIRSHKYAKADADRPVTGVSHDYARAYAKMRGKRLLREDEWTAALNTFGFVPAGMRTWEWVDDGKDDARTRPVRRVNEGKARRKPAGDKSVTFRLAADL